MRFARKILTKLEAWKASEQGGCAYLIEGARRVGKSFIAEDFAKRHYRSYLLLNFSIVAPEVKELFVREASNLDRFFSHLQAMTGVQLFVRESLIIFDEVQLFPKARELIKFLVADGRYDYLETGSLLSLKQNVESIVIPSEEEHVAMHPMGFDEYLAARGEEAMLTAIREAFEARQPMGALHRRAMVLFREYLILGGMPQVLEKFLPEQDFEAADRVKRRILALYREDIRKFAGRYAERVSRLFEEIPAQLCKKEKTYRLSRVERGAKFRSYENAFVWLGESMIVNNIFNATDPTSVGIALSQEFTTRKIYFADTGLLVTAVLANGEVTHQALYKQLLTGNLAINEGMFMENVVAQMLRASGKRLFFYSRRNPTTHRPEIEIDFLIQRGERICPIEVKSGNYRSHTSLDKFRQRFGKAIGEPIILYPKDLMLRDGILHLPLYMAMCL
ncbi:MAG: ATP-binding protein [Candidatus Spyradenecus sp.]